MTVEPFAEIIRRESEQAATKAKTATTAQKMTMRKMPEPRQALTISRSFREVDPSLRTILWKLARGQLRWPLLLHGPAGTGKTCAALCLCDLADTAAYRTAEQVCREILVNSINWEWIGRSDLAVLDEIGLRTDSRDLDYVAVKQFADRRDTRPAIYITNAKPQDLVALYDERIHSRLCCGTWYELAGKDRRMT